MSAFLPKKRWNHGMLGTHGRKKMIGGSGIKFRVFHAFRGRISKSQQP